MNAPELYAVSEGKECKGKRECHWCGAACEEKWLHDEPPPLIGVRRSAMVARPNNPWICSGCWLWRRQRISIRYLDGNLHDTQTPVKHSWWITSRTSLCFTRDHRELLYKLVTSPPPQFALVIRTPGSDINMHLQMAIVNETNGLTVNTPLWFTLDNIKHQFTLYELDEALKRDATGKEPGVRVLANMFDGLVPKIVDEPLPPAKVGHPKNLDDSRILDRRVGKKENRR